MLKLSQKRGRDWNSDFQSVDPCSPSMASFSRFPTPQQDTNNPFFSKKVRNEASDMSVDSPQMYRSPTRAESPFVPSPTYANEQLTNQNVDNYFTKRRIRNRNTSTNEPNGETNNNVSNELSEKLFTFEQVKEIVQRFVAEREAALREEYDKILQERLQEQFKNFAKFNEDYISRQLKNSDWSYLS
mmetsp:Transcript_7948/g.10924  ORF Transcript_7948/g.10924 Transcript_7948/m.10924 type:complete len:186 (+) Transcript_7948:86-643(+)